MHTLRFPSPPRHRVLPHSAPPATGGVLLALALCLGGCQAVGPDYVTPDAALQPAWNPDFLPEATSASDDAFWASFDDPVLVRLVQRAALHSPSIQAAAAQVAQAEANLAGTTAAGHPDAQLSGSRIYARPDLSSKLKGGNTGSTTIQVLGQLSWELDFWGKQRRAVEAGQASLAASREALEAARVSLQASVASAYLNVRIDEQRIGVAQANLAEQAESLRIAEARFRLGAVSEQDWRQSQTQYAQTLAQLPVLEDSLGAYRRSLAVLLGETPDRWAELVPAGDGASLPRTPLQAAAGEPRDLLRRRPDVRQAERLAAAESARIGQAQAALYPTFDLAGTFGYATTGGLGTLLHADNRTASLGPSVLVPLFDRARLSASVDAQRASFDQAVANYRSQVLKAQQEVEDASQAIAAYRAQLAALQAAQQSATRSAQLATLRYRSGDTDFTTVTSAEQSLLQTADARVQAEGALLQAHVSEWRALGGLGNAAAATAEAR